MVWYLVNALWVQGWSMHLIHAVAILAAALVTLAASVIVVSVVIRYRRVLEGKNRELERLAAIGEIVARVAHYQKNLLNGLRGGLYVTNGAMAKGDWEKLREGWRMLHGSVQRIERLTLDVNMEAGIRLTDDYNPIDFLRAEEAVRWRARTRQNVGAAAL